MSWRQEPSYHITQGDRPRGPSPLSYGLGVILCLLGITYLGLFLASRTGGFRATVEERLSRKLGLPVSLKKVEATPALNLRMEGLATRGSQETGRPGLRASEVLLEWSIAGLIWRDVPPIRRLRVKGGEVVFAPGSAGGWEPAALERLGSLIAEWGGFHLSAPSAEEQTATSAATAKEGAAKPEMGDWQRIALELSDSRMQWLDASGQERARAEDMALTVTPVELPNRRITHVHLTLKEGRVGDRRVTDFVFEMIRAGEQDILLTMAGDWRPVGSREPEAPADLPRDESPRDKP